VPPSSEGVQPIFQTRHAENRPVDTSRLPKAVLHCRHQSQLVPKLCSENMPLRPIPEPRTADPLVLFRSEHGGSHLTFRSACVPISFCPRQPLPGKGASDCQGAGEINRPTPRSGDPHECRIGTEAIATGQGEGYVRTPSASAAGLGNRRSPFGPAGEPTASPSVSASFSRSAPVVLPGPRSRTSGADGLQRLGARPGSGAWAVRGCSTSSASRPSLPPPEPLA
jgi:hypothetical protein